MIVISSALVLADQSDGLSLDHPVIGYHNVVTPSTILADFEDANYPASNLANPATHLEWRSGDDSAQEITITTNYVDEIDYVAVARHNWGSGEIPVSIGYYDDSSPAVWVDLVEEVMLPDDGPAIFRFTPQSRDIVKIHLDEGLEEPRAAVIYVGKLLVVERRIYVGHAPMPHARKVTVVNGKSETGNFLGRIQLGEGRESTVPLSLITPAWYREYMDPFLIEAKEVPFFFGWRPQSYPFEIGYGWLMDDPMPTPNSSGGNLIAFDMKVGGVA